MPEYQRRLATLGCNATWPFAESEGHFVRVLYNGVAQAVVEDMVEGQLCRWDDFARKLAAWIPDKSLCAKFYDFYTSITITPPQAAKHLEPAF